MPDLKAPPVLGLFVPNRFSFAACMVFAIVMIQSPTVTAETWPVWRGSTGDNHAIDGDTIPNQWNLETGENIVWKTKVPGRGHSSPVVTGDAIFLTTADKDKGTQSALKFDRNTGELLGEKVLHRGGIPDEIHYNNSHASSTACHDGSDLFVSFYTNDSISLSKLSSDLELIWQKTVCDFQPSQFKFGYAASPLIVDDLIIVAAEYDGPGSGLYGLDRQSGNQVWKTPRPSNLTWASPIAATVAGQRQVFLAGADKVCSYDPASGKENWCVDAGTAAICGTVVWNQDRIFFSGGYPGRGTWCVAGDGSREAWYQQVHCYEQSLLIFGDHLLAVDESGVGHCLQLSDGTVTWKQRLLNKGRKRISASPLLVGDRIFVAGEDGGVVVLAANADRCEVLSRVKTGDSIFASPVAVDDRLYLRPAVGFEEDRQEYLIAIAASSN